MSPTEQTAIDFVCPQCRSDLVRDTERFICTDAECRRAYAILDGIPKMLVDDADILNTGEWNAVVRREDQSTAPA